MSTEPSSSNSGHHTLGFLRWMPTAAIWPRLKNAINNHCAPFSNIQIVRALGVGICLFLIVLTWLYMSHSSDDLAAIDRFEPAPFLWWGSNLAGNKTPAYNGEHHHIAHLWLARSIDKYEMIPFNWDRKCEDIDPERYAQDLRYRVERAYKAVCALCSASYCVDL